MTKLENAEVIAQAAAKAAYEAELADCLSAGMAQDEAHECAQFVGGMAYDSAFDRVAA